MNLGKAVRTLSLAALVFTPVVSVGQSDTAECTVAKKDTGEQTSDAFYSLNGQQYGELDLPISLQQSLYDARLEHYKVQIAIIDQALLLGELERLAKASGLSVDEMAENLFRENTPTSEAIEKFYDTNKDRISVPLESIESQIIEALVQRDIVERQMEMLDKLKAEGDFELSLPKPVAPHADIAIEGAPRKGAEKPKITIVEFADYQCPHCQKAAAALEAVVNDYKDDVALVFMDFPVNPSGISREIAEGAACADQQDKFWRYHDLAFERQSTLNSAAVMEIAEAADVDLDAFQACIQSSVPATIVSRGESEAIRLGITGTPAIFLNGRRLHLHDIESELSGAVISALSEINNQS